jgi:hypothetical protein
LADVQHNTRDIVFVSHANPEDNNFCRWLTMRLAMEGYPVWLDLHRLLGGESFWADIEDAIRNRAVKILYALSRTSNIKPGALKELSLAQTVAKVQRLRDFVIPLKIDDLPHADININLHQLNAITFENSWAEGFQQLLLKLEQDGVQKDAHFSPDAVTTWWRTQVNANAGVINEPEDCLSNWFAITHMPAKLFCHEGKTIEDPGASDNISLPYPTVEQGGRWISFSDAAHLAPALAIRRTIDFATKDVIEGLLDERYIPRSEAKKIVSYLLVDNWVRMMRLREMAVYQLSNHRFCGALRQNQVPDDKIAFAGMDGKSAWRGIVGYKTMARANGPSWVRFWHFAVQARAQFFPVWAYLITNHVVFSEDGQHLWDSPERQHSARRSQCKNWWNDDWRDRMLAMMTWLSGGADQITIDCGGDVLEVSPRPLTFASPVRLARDGAMMPVDIQERERASTEMDDAEGGCDGESEGDE